MFRLLAVVVLFLAAVPNYQTASSIEAQRLFDRYGLIRWEDERARLDNFAIQLTHDPQSIGYIVAYDGKNICAGKRRHGLSGLRNTLWSITGFRGTK